MPAADRRRQRDRPQRDDCERRRRRARRCRTVGEKPRRWCRKSGVPIKPPRSDEGRRSTRHRERAAERCRRHGGARLPRNAPPRSSAGTLDRYGTGDRAAIRHQRGRRSRERAAIGVGATAAVAGSSADDEARRDAPRAGTAGCSARSPPCFMSALGRRRQRQHVGESAGQGREESRSRSQPQRRWRRRSDAERSRRR